MKSVRFAFIGLLVLCVLLWAAQGFSQEGEGTRTIVAEGAGVVINNDVALARDNAINDSLRKAVEQAVGTVISSETIVKNFEVINDQIYARSQGYIQNYRILDESVSDNLYRVKIDASVSLGSIKGDLQALGLLMARKGMPRIMVLIAEQNVGQMRPSYYWDSVDLSVCENVIQSNFLKDGFTFVDRVAVEGEIKTVVGRGAKVTNSSAARLGKQAAAELVIVGKAFAKYAGNVAGTTMKSLQANVTARAIRADNGVVIASANERSAAVHIDDITGGSEAIRKASEKLADKLKSQIVAKWQAEVSSTALIALTVHQIKSYTDFMKLKQALKDEVRGVKNLYIRKMEAGVARMDVEMEGSALVLADRLAVKQFQGFSLEITTVGQNSIEINLVK